MVDELCIQCVRGPLVGTEKGHVSWGNGVPLVIRFRRGIAHPKGPEEEYVYHIISHNREQRLEKRDDQ